MIMSELVSYGVLFSNFFFFDRVEDEVPLKF